MDYSRFDIFQWLEPQSQQAFSEAARTIRFPAGRLIYAQGDQGDTMFRVIKGQVRMSVLRADGRQLLYQLFQAGDCFGTSSLVDGGPRPQTAETSSPCEIQVIERKEISRLQATLPDLSEALLRLLSMHMRLLSEYFAGSNLDGIVAWLAHRLVEAADAFGISQDDGVSLSREFSQSEFAAMVGTSRQTVNKAMAELRNRGLIATRGNMLHIPSIERLADVARGGQF